MVETEEHEVLEIVKPHLLMALISFSVCLSLHALSQKRCYMITSSSVSGGRGLVDQEKSPDLNLRALIPLEIESEKPFKLKY
jgi:hypothetical protein